MATILPPADTTFLDANGFPLAGGTVQFYIPGTTTPKDTYQNTGQTVLNTNPVILDSAGRAIIFGSGTYRQVVKDVNGNLMWDQITSEPGAGINSFGGTSGGTANAQTLSSGVFNGLDGQTITFIAGLSNTTALTMSIGGSSPIPVNKNGAAGPIPLVVGDVILGNIYSITYSASLAAFQLAYGLTVIPSTAIMQFSTGSVTLGDGLTDYIGTAWVSASPTDVQIRAPFSGTVIAMYANNAGSATGNRIYTLMVNGSATAVTCSSTGTAVTSQDTTHTAAVIAGQVMSIQLVTTGGVTPSTTHNVSIAILRTS